MQIDSPYSIGTSSLHRSYELRLVVPKCPLSAKRRHLLSFAATARQSVVLVSAAPRRLAVCKIGPLRCVQFLRAALSGKDETTAHWRRTPRLQLTAIPKPEPPSVGKLARKSSYSAVNCTNFPITYSYAWSPAIMFWKIIGGNPGT